MNFSDIFISGSEFELVSKRIIFMLDLKKSFQNQLNILYNSISSNSKEEESAITSTTGNTQVFYFKDLVLQISDVICL